MPKVHAIMCTYMGDNELDIGKTARWVQNFCDTMFFYDANNSFPAMRYAIDYTKSWPTTKFAYHDQNAHPGIFVDPSGFRRMAFEAADKAWKYDPADWVIFVDGTEGLTVDVPHDALEWYGDTAIYRYLYDEIAAAGANTMLSIPVRVFLRQGEVTTNTYLIDAVLEVQLQADRVAIEAELAATTDPDDMVLIQRRLDTANLMITANRAIYWGCSPEYHLPFLDSLRLTRMINVMRARQGTVPWSQLDTYSASYAPLTAHVGLVSYSYARYSEVDYESPELWVQANDSGFASRLSMQTIPGRQISALPSVYATPDPLGYTITVPPGAARVSATVNYDTMTFTFTGHVTNESGNEVYTWTFADAGTATGQVVNHVYATIDGTAYTVTMTVNDPDVVGARTATMIASPGAYPTITPQDVIPPDDALTRTLSPPYCFYINQMGQGDYVQVFCALWRKNPRDGAWFEDLELGPMPRDPATGEPDVGLDAETGLPIDPSRWEEQPPQDKDRV